jgi:hypothetical protein
LKELLLDKAWDLFDERMLAVMFILLEELLKVYKLSVSDKRRDLDL